MTRRHKLAVGLLVAVAVPVFLGLYLYGAAWYYRWRATQLLAATKSLRPGITTPIEYDAIMKPFRSFELRDYDTDRKAEHASFGMTNHPDWVDKILGHLWFLLPSEATTWTVFESPIFTVSPTFEDGKLSELSIREAQGEGHPHAATVRIHGGQLLKSPFQRLGTFSGYWLYQRTPGLKGPVWFSYLELDDRATPEERRKALDFHFDCFTGLQICMDGSRFLQPAPKRESQQP